MTIAWQTVLGLTAATIAIRAAGPVLLGGRDLPARIQDIVFLLAPALLAALVVTETFGRDARGLTIDERLGGVAAAALVLAWRPRALLPAIAVAALAAALLEAL